MMEAKKRRPQSALHRAHRLLQILSCGVVPLLSRTETVQLLSTCREIRFDESVVGCALRSATPSPRWRVVDHHVNASVATSTYPKILQLTWRMDELLSSLGAHPTMTPKDRATAALQGVMLLSGTDAMTIGMDALLAVVVRACHLVAAPGKSSRFKAHWTHLTSTAASDDTVVCELCEAAVASVCSYREGTERFANELEESVLQAEERWESEGRSASEVFELSYDFQQACMENEPFYDAYVANKNDMGVLQHVVTSGRFPVSRQCVYAGDLMAVLGENAREACREVYQALRRLLASMCERHVVHTVALTEDGEQVDVVAGRAACGLSSSLLVGCVVVGE